MNKQQRFRTSAAGTAGRTRTSSASLRPRSARPRRPRNGSAATTIRPRASSSSSRKATYLSTWTRRQGYLFDPEGDLGLVGYPNLGRSVLGCIEADSETKRLSLQHRSRSTVGLIWRKKVQALLFSPQMPVFAQNSFNVGWLLRAGATSAFLLVYVVSTLRLRCVYVVSTLGLRWVYVGPPSPPVEY